jgi:hypothetical protein
MNRFWTEQTPYLISATGGSSTNVDQNVAKVIKVGEQMDLIEQKYLDQWWTCHTKYMAPEDKRILEVEGRWQEYLALPNLLQDILSRYDVLDDKTYILARYGHLKSAAEIRAMHPTITEKPKYSRPDPN